MLEKVEEIQKQPISLEKKNHKSIKSLFNSKLRSRAPSREFNDPIYAGFDINEQNKEQVNWGPWVVSNQATLRHSHSLHSSIKKMAFSDPIQLHSLSVNKKHVIPYTQEYKSRSPSRNELPEIKEKGKTNFLQIKLGQTDQKSNKSMATKQLKFKPRITAVRADQTYFRRPQDQYRHRLKLGTVVYNYCTNNDVDECLLNYHRRSDPQLQKINKQEAMTKYEGLKSFWNKKNSVINIKHT